MKKLLFFGGVMLLGHAAAYGAALCLPGTLQSYIDLGAAGCQAGEVVFNDFFLDAGSNFTTPIDPSAVQVTPGGTAFHPTLLLTLNAVASAGEVRELMFDFGATGKLTGASVALGAPVATGDAAITGVLDVCADASFLPGAPIGCPSVASTAIAFKTAIDAQLSDSVTFIPSDFFNVFVDLTIDAGLNGTASLDSAAVSIAAVPEPVTVLTMAMGLAMIAALRKRRLQ